MKCKMCGTAFVTGDKFCQSCGRELPAIQEPVSKSVQANDDDAKEKDALSTSIGKNSILSNSQIHTTNTTTTVNNTTIEDDTKKSIVCAVSGKRVLYIESACCRVCNKDVSLDYYNEKIRRCDNCHQEFLQKYRSAYQEALESGGGIDRHERAELEILSQQLQLTEKEKATIETEIRNSKASLQSEDDSDLSDLFEIELAIVKKELFKKNDLSSALLRLKQIFDQVQTNDEISCLYFLLKSLKSPDMYVTNFEGAVYDEFWENYWLFIAHINKGDHTKGMVSINNNKKKFPDKKSIITLSEIVYLIMRFQLEQNDVLIDTANEKFSMIESVSGDLLTKLYKSNEKLLGCFDYGLLKFVNVSPPDEPGIKEYFSFFTNHLYKIPPEVPKTAPVSPNPIKVAATPVVAPSTTVSGPPPIISAPPSNIQNKPNKISKPDVSNDKKIPTIPSIPKLPIPTKKTDLPIAGNQINTKGTGTQKPVLPSAPPLPAPSKTINIPKKPPMPGKK